MEDQDFKTLGYLPVDFSLHFNVIMTENREYFRIDCWFCEQGKTDKIDIALNFFDDILKD